MCFRKKVQIKAEEKTLIGIINEELNGKESPILFDFTKRRDEFYFCGTPYYCDHRSYELFDFNCAVQQINRAVDLLKRSLIAIKNAFDSHGLKNKIALDKINALFALEKSFQTKMNDEQNKQGVGKFPPSSTTEMFQDISRAYLQFVLETKTELIEYTKRNLNDYEIISSITEIINEQANILPKYLSNFKDNLNGYTIVYNLENFLRVLILIVLRGKTSKQMMKQDTFEYLQKQKKQEEINKWCDERYGGDLFYLTFAQLMEIIEYNDSSFKSSGINIAKINGEIEKIGTIRNKLAHNNLITSDDLNTLKVYSKNVYKYFESFGDDVKKYIFNKKQPK